MTSPGKFLPDDFSRRFLGSLIVSRALEIANGKSHGTITGMFVPQFWGAPEKKMVSRWPSWFIWVHNLTLDQGTHKKETKINPVLLVSKFRAWRVGNILITPDFDEFSESSQRVSDVYGKLKSITWNSNVKRRGFQWSRFTATWWCHGGSGPNGAEVNRLDG